MLNLEEDRALLDGFRSGTSVVLRKVYFAYVRDVEALLRKGFSIESQGWAQVPGLRDQDLVRELIQEVFARAFAESARLSYDGLRPYRPYLLTIAKNLLIDRVRKIKSERGGAAAETLDQGTLDQIDALIAAGKLTEFAPAPPAEEKLHWNTLREAAQNYLQALESESREFVRLRYDQEHSQRDVADQMGLSRRRVRTIESRVESGLLRYLKKQRLLEH